MEKTEINFIELNYFAFNEKGICASDFDNIDKKAKINLFYVLSLSEIEKFNLPLSGVYVGSYALLTMGNNDKYYIREEEYKYINSAIKEQAID